MPIKMGAGIRPPFAACMVEAHSIGFVAPLRTRPCAMGRGPRLLQTAFAQSAIVPVRLVLVVVPEPVDGDEHPADTAIANTAANPTKGRSPMPISVTGFMAVWPHRSGNNDQRPEPRRCPPATGCSRSTFRGLQ